PIWLRLVRSGDNFSGYWAVDVSGMPGPWQQLGGAHTTSMPNTVFVGLALTAHNNGAVATAVFDHLTVTGTTTAALPPTILRLPDGGGGEAGSSFRTVPVSTTASWTTTFTLTDRPVNGAADSLNFVLQNDPRGTAALGAGGGGGGYLDIGKSIAIKFDLYTHGSHNPSTGLFINGQSPDSSAALDVPLTGINLGSGGPLPVTITYHPTP